MATRNAVESPLDFSFMNINELTGELNYSTFRFSYIPVCSLTVNIMHKS